MDGELLVPCNIMGEGELDLDGKRILLPGRSIIPDPGEWVLATRNHTVIEEAAQRQIAQEVLHHDQYGDWCAGPAMLMAKVPQGEQFAVVGIGGLMELTTGAKIRIPEEEQKNYFPDSGIREASVVRIDINGDVATYKEHIGLVKSWDQETYK